MVVVVFNITIQTANIFKNKCSQNNKVNNVLQTLLWQLLFVIHIWNTDFPWVSVVNSNKLLLVVWVLWRYFSTVVINAWPHDIYIASCVRYLMTISFILLALTTSHIPCLYEFLHSMINNGIHPFLTICF